MTKPRRIESNIQLLVEGNDPRNFFEAFTRHLLFRDVQIHDFGGVNDLQNFLSAFIKMPGFDSVRSLGIVRDAETSAGAAFQSVQSSLAKAGLPVPNRAGEPRNANPAVTVLILPGGERSGMLETLLCETFENDGINQCIDDFFGCAESLPGVSIDRPDKARACAYLATRPDPHLSVGVAAKRGYWNLGHEAFTSIRDFLTTLYRIPST